MILFCMSNEKSEVKAMKLSKRLRAIINEIECENIIDIGTDHAYVPIMAILKQKAKSAIASDVRRGPLDIAQKNIIEYKLENKIQTKISNGFDNIIPRENSTVIISGMGGIIICEIIERAKNILPSIKQFVLQPQNNIYYVRKALHANGYAIKKETILYQNGFYNIINAHRGKDVFYSKKDYAAGKLLLENKDPLLKKFLAYKIEKLAKIKSFNPQANMLYKLYCESLLCFQEQK